MPDVTSNTSPVQYRHQAGVLHLLPALFGQVLRADTVFEGTGSTLFDGHVIMGGVGGAGGRRMIRFGARDAAEPAPAHGPFAPSGGRARRGFGGGTSTWK